MLTKKNLYIRIFNNSDLNSLIKIYNNPNVMKFIPSSITKWGEDEIEEKFKQKPDRKIFVIERLKDATLIGEAAIFEFSENEKFFELGYIIDEKFWNNGYGREICNLLISYCFEELKANSVIARMYNDNIASAKVSEYNNMKLEKEDILENKSIRLTYTITREDFESANQNVSAI